MTISYLVTDPCRSVAGRKVVRIKVHLELRKRDLKCSTLAQAGMTRPTLTSGVVAEVQVNPVGVEVVGGFDDVITGEDLCGCAPCRRLLLRRRIFVGVRVDRETLK